MPHDIELVAQAIDLLLVNEREARDAERAEQYGTGKSSFYPSELGSGDRKIVYGFFKDRIAEKSSLTGQNIRVFDNGDYVHMRYRDYMLRIGALLSEEQSLKIEQNDLERVEGTIEGGYKMSGRYDQIIDLNVIRAYLQGFQAYDAFMEANFEPHEVLTTTLDTTTGSILEEKKSTRWVPKANYEPDAMVIDIKSMNPWGYKRLENKDFSDIQGYIDQVNAYEDKLGIHKGGLLVEDKEKNRLYPVPVDYEPGRIHGGEVHEGLSRRLARLWEHVKNETVPEERCAGANVSKFPCKWSTGQCDFFSHCWNDEHSGRIIPGGAAQEEEGVELPSIEELVEYLSKPEQYNVSAIILYLENFPGGQDRFTITKDMPEAMLNMNLDYYADYVVDLDYVDLEGNIQGSEEETPDPAPQEQKTVAPTPEVTKAPVSTDEEDIALPPAGSDGMTDENGVYNFDAVTTDKAIERAREDGQKEINCVKCQQLIIYKVLRGTKQCTSCGHKNLVHRPE